MTYLPESFGLVLPGATAPSGEFVQIDLAAYKEYAREQSLATGTLVAVGHLWDGTNPATWTGDVSLSDKLRPGHSNTLSQRDLDIAERLLAEHFVPTSAGAPEDCVEDRTVVGYNSDDVGSYAAPRGPKIQGATVDEAVVHRLNRITEGDSQIGELAIVEDVITVANRPGRRYSPGGHTGATTGLGKTGCGSVDFLDLKLATYKNSTAAEAIKDKTEFIAGLGGAMLDSGYFERLTDSALELHGQAPKYFDQRLVHAINTVRRYSGRDLPHVEGKHPAFAVVLNLVPGTTLHSSEFNVRAKEATGKNISAFCLDVWHVLEEHPRETALRIIAQGINTLTHLTDGSLRLYLRNPK